MLDRIKNLKQDNKGFTIIEVLIVLAIAGLIILIVFLAVPALQRNSRNTQYRNDVATYLGAVSEWSTNNNGRVPANAADLAAVLSLANLGTMNPPSSVLTGAQSNTVAVGDIVLVTGAKCDPGTVGNTVGGVGSRAFAVMYAVETASSTAPQCSES